MKVTEQDSTSIRFVIEQQLQAFQQDNAEEAFTFASPEIKAQFQTPENFFKMVKIGYQAVYRPRSVLFENITTIQGNITQLVLLLDPDGVPVRALYLMEKQPEGVWKINGCFLVPVEAEII
ncbi:hypothetical protein NIES4071_23160 [Calothrix sp. NIES-4071]|nr:hypothetical protein NIES4071_23160 [Calothrix sp. NIES-4071]BAZ56641.1 hypothetical protein NIES4105_23110 [Calothrix sp. NIES-4105]